ncbi:MAG TPA: acyltransferase [Steroidobacteraceae bacterium]|jgi:peptidoglycan/LPS O-acetylase OafA/YrhL
MSGVSSISSPAPHGRHEARLQELDVLRGLAAAAVVLFHYTVRYGALYGYPTPPALRVPLGFYGVEVFFCISGFVIFMTLDRTRRPMDFVVSRGSRLWPAYIVAIAITFLVVHIFGLAGRQTTVVQALVNLSMLHELVHVPDVDAVYWSLQVELIFYCWMLLAYLSGALRHIRTVLCVALLAPVVYFLSRRLLGHEPSYLAGTLLLVAYLPYFTIGIAAYNLRAGRGSPYKDLLLMVAAVAVIALCGGAGDWLVGALAAGVFCLLAANRLAPIAQAPLVFLGTISYPLYLLHQNIGYVVIREAMRHGISPNAAIVTAILVCVALAAALTWWVEKPARAWLRDRYARHRARASGLSAMARETVAPSRVAGR